MVVHWHQSRADGEGQPGFLDRRIVGHRGILTDAIIGLQAIAIDIAEDEIDNGTMFYEDALWRASGAGSIDDVGEIGIVRGISDGLTTGGQISLSANGSQAQNISLVNSFDVKFTQPTISQNFSDGGTVNGLMNSLLSGLPADSVPTIRVVTYEGDLYSLDNRRLAAFQAAGVGQIPIQNVSLDDPDIAAEFLDKFNPIDGGSIIVVTPNAAGRNSAEELLRAYDKIW
jgi:hypothetical protein